MVRLIKKIHRLLGANRLVALMCVKIRNQVEAVIGAYLGESINPIINGECAIIDVVAPCCHCFVDVGANKGEWTEYFLKRANANASGFLFEPSSEAFSFLERTFGDSGLNILNLAVGEHDGKVLFVEEPDCGRTSSVIETHASSDIAPREVSICSLDSFFFNGDTMIDYLKIDAEGYDFKILLGAKKLLGEHRIRFVQFEYNMNWVGAGHSLKQAISYMADFGYDIFVIRSTGLHPFRYEVWGDFFRYSNFFACRQSDRKEVKALIGKSI